METLVYNAYACDEWIVFNGLKHIDIAQIESTNMSFVGVQKALNDHSYTLGAYSTWMRITNQRDDI